MQILYDNIILIYLLPFIALIPAVFAQFIRCSVSDKTVAAISVSSNALCFAYSLALLYTMLSSDFQPVSFDFIWLKTSDFAVSMGCFIDKYSVCSLFIILITSLAVQISAVKFLMDNEKFFPFVVRFNLLLISIMAFVLSSNFVQAVIFASLSGACVFLLLKLNGDKYNVARYTKHFMIIDRIGDFCLLTALFIMLYFINAYELSFDGVLLNFSHINDIVADFYVYISDESFYTLCLIIFMGVCAKSGIFPFHSKLAASFSDYSPAFYFFFVALTITGSLFVIRFLPLFDLSEKFVLTIFIWFALLVFYSFIYEAIHTYFMHRVGNSCIIYACLTSLYVILPLTLSDKAEIFNTDIMLYLPFLFFAVLYIFWFFSGEKIYFRNSALNNISEKEDIVTRAGCYVLEQILDFCCNITRLTDKYLIPSSVNLIGYFARVKSWIIAFTQNGKIRNYLIYSLLFISVMLLLYLFILLEAENINV